MLHDRLSKPHPEYQRMAGTWQFLRASYDGGAAWTAKYIRRLGPREVLKDYEDRKTRAVFPNYVGPAVRSYASHIMKGQPPIARSSAPDTYQDWLKNVDRRGTSADVFWRGVIRRALLYGSAYVLVDMPAAPKGVQTKADDDATGRLPYLVDVSPLAVVDWKLDRFGRFEWVRIEDTVDKSADALSVREEVKEWTVWYPDRWDVIDEEGKTVLSGENPLGAVPLIPVRVEDSEVNELAGGTFMEDFASINRMLANALSLRDTFLGKNMLQILTMSINYMAESGADADAEPTLADGSTLMVPEGLNPPEFITPDVSGVEWALQHTEELRWEMYRILTQKDARTRAEVDQQSGEAKVQDFAEQAAYMANVATTVEVAENLATQLWFAWQQVNMPAGMEVKYPSKFTVRNLEADLALALGVKGVYGAASPTLVARYLSETARVVVPDATPEEQVQIEEELAENAANATAAAVDLGRVAREAANPPATRQEDDEDGDTNQNRV